MQYIFPLLHALDKQCSPVQSSPKHKMELAKQSEAEQKKLGNGVALQCRGSYDFGADLECAFHNGDDRIPMQSSPSFEFGVTPLDPPTRLIEEFLHKQRRSGQISLDLDVEGLQALAPEAVCIQRKLSAVSETRERMHQEAEYSLPREGSVEIVKSPVRLSSSRYVKVPSKSRMAEPKPPTESVQNTFKSTIFRSGVQQHPGRSGLIGKTGPLAKEEDEEDDPLKGADLPNKYSTQQWDVWFFIQLGAFIIIISGLVCSTTLKCMKHRKVLGLLLWKWAVLILVVFSGRLLSGWIIRILVFFIEMNFLLRKRVLYFVYGLYKSVQNCIWCAIMLLAWRLLLDPKVELPFHDRKALTYVSKVLICFLVAAFIWLGKTLVVKVLASSYHVSTYFDRIQESLFNQYILETLSGPPVMQIEKSKAEENKISEVVAGLKAAGAKIADIPTMHINPIDSLRSNRSGLIGRSQLLKEKRTGAKEKDESINTITIDELTKLNQRNVSAWNMKRLINIVKMTRISTLAQTIEEAESTSTEIKSEWHAKAAARSIFENVAKPGKKYIEMEDFLRFLPEADAIKAFALFDGAADIGKITKQSLVNWLVNVYQDRKALAYTLNDTKTAVNKLHRVINVLVGVAIAVIWLLILGIATTKLLVVVSSQMLLIVFMFGNTCKTVFEGIIFVFVVHPFDVGDRCVIDGVQMVVEEMNILTTVFLRYDNEKIYYPNSVLQTKPISNFYRSPDMGDAINFVIHISTPTEKIDALKEKISRYIESHTHHWYVDHHVVLMDIEDMNGMKMALWLRHTMNHQNVGEKWIRRSQLLLELRKYFQELGIEYRLLPQDVHLLNNPASLQAAMPYECAKS